MHRVSGKAAGAVSIDRDFGPAARVSAAPPSWLRHRTV